MEKHKTCSFIGHRKIEITAELSQNLKDIIENLIIKDKVTIFLFGSKSNFDSLCYTIVTKLKEKYFYIKRIAYTCKSEGCILETEKEKWEKIFYNLKGEKVNIITYEEEFEYKTKYISGKASYIERNKEMIDNSNYCIFYYNKDYKPQSKNLKETKSGTKIAFKYAIKNNKRIINVFSK